MAFGNMKLTLKGFLRLELLQNKSKVVRPQAADTRANRAGASEEKEDKAFTNDTDKQSQTH